MTKTFNVEWQKHTTCPSAGADRHADWALWTLSLLFREIAESMGKNAAPPEAEGVNTDLGYRPSGGGKVA